MCSNYDRGITVFSPNGSLMQVDYATQATKHASAAVGVKSDTTVVLGVEMRHCSSLQDKRTLKKIHALDEHVGLTFSGLTADARILINRAVIECQSHRMTVEDPVTVDYITRYIAGVKQLYTQNIGLRPFGVSFLIGGFDIDGTSHLYQTEVSGLFNEWKATAIGRCSKTVQTYLETHYTGQKVAAENGAIKLAIEALLQAVSSSSTIEIAVLRRNRPMYTVKESTVERYIREIEREKAKGRKRKQ